MPISAEVRAEITTLMEKVKRGEKLVSMIDKILALLKKSGLAWSQKLLPHQVGCQLRNRDGVGISTSEVHGFITDILQVSKISPGGNSLHLLGNGSIRDRGCGIQPPAAEGKCRKASKCRDCSMEGKEWAIQRVVAVEIPHSKKDWFPQCKDVKDFTFFRFSTFEDSGY